MMGFRFPAYGRGASSWAFLVRWVSQQCAFWKEGRQGFFSSSLFVQSCRGKFLLSHKCLVQFLFSSGIIGLLDFPIFCGYYLEYCLSWWRFFFLFFVLCYFVSGVCLFVYYTCLLFVYFGFAGSVGISLAGRVIYSLCVCVSAVCIAGPVQFYSCTFLERMAGLYRFFPFLWLCCSGYGIVEMVRGVVHVSCHFL